MGHPVPMVWCVCNVSIPDNPRSLRLHEENSHYRGFPVLFHADYPHEPGTLYDCAACEFIMDGEGS